MKLARKVQPFQNFTRTASQYRSHIAVHRNAALLVDRLSGLRGLDAFVSSEPAPQGAPSYYGSIYVDSQGQRWQELNLQTLSLHPTFLGIGA